MVTVHQSAMAVFRTGGKHAALKSGRTTDLSHDFPSYGLGASRGPWEGVVRTTVGKGNQEDKHIQSLWMLPPGLSIADVWGH